MLGELFNLGASVFAPSDMVQKKKKTYLLGHC